MPLVKPSDVRSGLIKQIRVLVGDRLSTLPNRTDDLPLASVIRDRAKGPRPDFPYIVVDSTTSDKAGGAWLRDESNILVDDEYKVTYKTEQTLSLTITCYGIDADDILNQLRVSLVDGIVRNDLNAETGAVFQHFSGIDDLPIFIETDFIDGCTMDATFTAVSEWSPTVSSVIETVTGSASFDAQDQERVTKPIFVDENNPIGD